MTRVLVTGFNARMASPRRATRDTCFAALLVAALRDAGCTVDHRDTTVTETTDDYDHVFVGVASPLAVSSNRTYGALATIGRTWNTERLTLFLDDPDVGKVPHGLASLTRKPEQFTKAFFDGRVDYALATTPHWRSWLLEVAYLLHVNNWPRLLVPAWPWADRIKLLAALPNTMQGHAVLVDLSSFMTNEPTFTTGRERFWVTEETFKSPWVRGLGLTDPVKNVARVNDTNRMIEYTGAWGMLEDATKAQVYGWFRPRAVLAARAHAVYVTRWQSMTSVGPMYTLLPHRVEQMSAAERDDLALEQRTRLAALSWDITEARAFVRDELVPTQTEEVS